jgi:hypothetical protein
VEIDLGVICASAPVLKPLLSKIPFSLSGTLTGGVSLEKKPTGSGYNSKMSTTAAERSRGGQTSVTNLSSKRKAEGLMAAPDLDRDYGRSYELKNWDEECAIASTEPQDRATRSQSEDAIMRADSNEDASKGRGFQKMWQKMRTRGSDSSGSDEDMTITMTSEIELSHEPASVYLPRGDSRYKEGTREHGAAKDHRSPSPSQLNRKAYL